MKWREKVNEENRCNYYSVIPATVRYDTRLKPAEKLLYGELTALSNKEGFCFAKNKYFAKLFNVTNGTVSKWLSHLQKLGYIFIEIIRNNQKEIIARHIYISDTPYGQKEPYPYCSKQQYPMVKNDIDNNINYNIDDLFNLIINNSNEIPEDFYEILNSLEFLYPQRLISVMQQDNLEKIKLIISVLYEIYSSNLDYILNKVDRETLIKIYSISEMNSPDNLKSYFKKSVINNYF